MPIVTGILSLIGSVANAALPFAVSNDPLAAYKAQLEAAEAARAAEIQTQRQIDMGMKVAGVLGLGALAYFALRSPKKKSRRRRRR